MLLDMIQTQVQNKTIDKLATTATRAVQRVVFRVDGGRDVAEANLGVG